jgi:peroxiredoxin
MVKGDMHFPGGPEPEQLAPDFDLPTVDGRRFRLSDHRGKRPVIIQFGSIT